MTGEVELMDNKENPPIATELAANVTLMLQLQGLHLAQPANSSHCRGGYRRH